MKRSGMDVSSGALLASLVSAGDELREHCTRTYFGRLCVAYTTRNSLKHYSASPWNFAIRDGHGWYHYIGIPNKVETRAKALRRAWYRAKWMHDGTYDEHYKANNEYEDDEVEGWTSHPHPCKNGLGGRMRRKVRAHEPPKGRVVVGGEEPV